ncbi:MAG: leucine-rich repeat domain-containing protein [Ruminococcus sp.]
MIILDLHDIYCRDGNGGFFVDEDKTRKVFSQFDNTREIFVTSSVLPIGARIIPEEAFLKAGEPFIHKHYEYIILENEVFRNNTNIEIVVMGENISEIGAYAFSNCINLKEIVLPDTQILINAFAFENCKSLKSICLPDTTNYIHTGTFKNCTSLEYVYVPEGCMGIDDNVFENCTSLKKIFLPKSLSYIGKYAFLGCVNLEEISGGENIEVISDFAFFGCAKLKNFPFNPNTRKISDSAFGLCPSSIPHFICTHAQAYENGIVKIPDGTICLTDSSVINTDGEKWKCVQLPESVRNISRNAFKYEETSFIDDLSEEALVFESLPEKMNMPEKYFRRKTPFDYEMAFLLAKTVWSDYVTFADYEAVILNQDNDFAQTVAQNELNCYCNEHLKNLLAHTDNSPKQLENIVRYAASYISRIDRELIDKLKLRVIKNDAVKALKILHKYCINDVQRSLNPDIDFCFNHLEPYNAELCEEYANLDYELHYKDSNEYVPDTVLKSVLYAYSGQLRNYCFEYNIKNVPPIVKNKYADMLAENFDKTEFGCVLDSLRFSSFSDLLKYMIPILRFADIQLLKRSIKVYQSYGGIHKELVKFYMNSALKLNESEGIEELIEEFKSSRWYSGEEDTDYSDKDDSEWFDEFCDSDEEPEAL